MGKPFYEPLVEFMMSGPSLAIVAEGERVIEGFRSLAGPTDPTTAPPGTIRGDLGRQWPTQGAAEPGARFGQLRKAPSARSASGFRRSLSDYRFGAVAVVRGPHRFTRLTPCI